MDKKINLDPERHVEILDTLLGDSDLMLAVNAAKTFEEGFELVAKKISKLTIEEFTASMDLLRQVVLAQMEKTAVQ